MMVLYKRVSVCYDVGLFCLSWNQKNCQKLRINQAKWERVFFGTWQFFRKIYFVLEQFAQQFLCSCVLYSLCGITSIYFNLQREKLYRVTR